MKILLLDDKKERTQDIEEITHDYKAELVTSHSLEDAKNKLKYNEYTLVMIDLVVPRNYKNRELSDNAGFELVKYIFETTDNICKPNGVIIVSDNLKEIDYLDDLNLYPLSIIDTNFANWKDRMRQSIDNYWLNINPVDVAIITAVDVEFEAIYDDEWSKDVESGALTFYRKEYHTKAKESVSAVLVQTENKGMVATGAAMSKLFKYYCPKKVFMIGISAGNPEETNFGDIIVATSSCDYSYGAVVENEEGELIFESEPTLITAADGLVNVFRKYSKDKTLSYTIRRSTNMSSYNTDIEIKLGVMACGPLVVKSKAMTEKYIRPFNRKYLGIDMETYAVYYSCKKNNCNDFMTIKSVSDHADKSKTHEHQRYCSKLSAELLKHYIYNEL